MERDGDSTFAVDLFTGVLVRQDAVSYVVTGQDELGDMLGRGVISVAEGRGAERGLQDLLDLIGHRRCCAARYPPHLRAGIRRTW